MDTELTGWLHLSADERSIRLTESAVKIVAFVQDEAFTEDAVNRAAESIWNCQDSRRDVPFTELPGSLQKRYRDMARAALVGAFSQ